MIESLLSLFASPPFPARLDMPILPQLFWPNLVADGLLALAFYAIPFALWAFLRHRNDLPRRGPPLLLGGFALLCGSYHLLHLWTPSLVDGIPALAVKVAAALAALAAALRLRPVLAGLMDLPDSKQLLAANQALETALQAHQETAGEMRKLSLAVEHSPSMVLITDRDGLIEYCNPAFSKLSGFGRQEMMGRRASIWYPDRVDPAARRALWDKLKRGETWEGEVREQNKNGVPYWCLEYVAPIRDEQGRLIHYVVMSHDISELKQSEETIRRLAYFDPVTELPNRALFMERLREMLGESRGFAVFHLDLDRFKNINDDQGHAFGDRVLAAVAGRLRQSLREQDILARLGDDEFALILPELSHPALAGAAATAIGAVMKEALVVDGHALFVTASIGISLYPADHADPEQLLKMADAALYRAKELGRNQYQFYKELPRRKDGEKNLALETGLRYALERGELEVYYQPKVEVDSGRCYAAEALLRWRRPGHGLVSPGQFIPLAEESGLIVEMGEWLLRAVCLQIAQWRDAGLDMAVAVNLSPHQFRQKNLLERIDAILEETGTDRSRLEFEITESTMMHDPQQAVDTVRRLKSRGLALSIDDFGTGYSSLSYLKLFPVDYLKIDRSFVQDIDAQQADPRIVRAIIALAHSLDIRVVAEGVETTGQFEFLKHHQCDLIQGYFFGPPMPADELMERARPGRPSLLAQRDRP